MFHSASVDQWSHDHPAPPTTVVNLDHSLNYLLHSTNGTVQPVGHPSSPTSSSSLISSLQTADITSQQLLHQQQPTVANTPASQPHPPVHSELHTYPACSNTGTQTVTHTAVQTEQCDTVPVVTSQQSVITMTSSEFDQKMEHMMATALLNAKDTVNTIEALSQSLLLKTVSRESSFMNLQHQLTSTQCVANNEAAANNQGVANSQGVTNTPRMTTIQELTNSHTLQECTGNQMKTRTSQSGHTPHVDHMTSSPQQHSYTLYNTADHHDDDDSTYLTR